MENVKVTLCPLGCGAFPDVEIVGDAIRIGEAGNLAVLKKDEWNVLVDLIQSQPERTLRRPTLIACGG